MARKFGFIVLLFLLPACAEQEPAATKIMKQMEGSNAVKQKVLIGWSEPIYSSKFGLAPNPNIDGKTLAEVVTSQTAGRDDGLLCSACHNTDDAQGGYAAPAEKNEASPALKPTDRVSNRTQCEGGDAGLGRQRLQVRWRRGC
ncbi:hypothetical protein [Oligoflexus tunisiensis]|uniref:hypothetical protein n=1 Tax=Oligoflexus tunisiensis TaxID=708132 RepID=UPI00114CAAD1|nr:hypothetical protein [Oligoflexus tunisiensis]